LTHTNLPYQQRPEGRNPFWPFVFYVSCYLPPFKKWVSPVPIPYPLKSPLIFLRKCACTTNSAFFDIKSQEISLNRGYYDLNLNPISLIKDWGFLLVKHRSQAHNLMYEQVK